MAHVISSPEIAGSESEQRDKVFDAFRRWGYVRADLDPLDMRGFLPHVALVEIVVRPGQQMHVDQPVPDYQI